MYLKENAARPRPRLWACWCNGIWRRLDICACHRHAALRSDAPGRVGVFVAHMAFNFMHTPYHWSKTYYKDVLGVESAEAVHLSCLT